MGVASYFESDFSDYTLDSLENCAVPFDLGNSLWIGVVGGCSRASGKRVESSYFGNGTSDRDWPNSLLDIKSRQELTGSVAISIKTGDELIDE